MIVILAKVPIPGRAKTRLAPALGDHGAARLAGAMAADVLAAVLATGEAARVAIDGPMDHPWVRALPFPVEAQPPGDLGRRLTWALRDGGTAIGTDAPTIPVSLLLDATPSRVTLAPARDGGYVRVSAPPEAVAAGLFEGIPWSTADTLRAQVARAAAIGFPARLLDPWYDIDEPADLAALRLHLAQLPPSVAPATRAALEALDAAPHR